MHHLRSSNFSRFLIDPCSILTPMHSSAAPCIIWISPPHFIHVCRPPVKSAVRMGRQIFKITRIRIQNKLFHWNWFQNFSTLGPYISGDPTFYHPLPAPFLLPTLVGHVNFIQRGIISLNICKTCTTHILPRLVCIPRISVLSLLKNAR